MSNLIYTDEMYNEYQKNRFINQGNLTESTAEGYKIVFKKASALERHLEKDLYEFNLPEIEQLLKNLRPGVTTTAANYVSVIKNYIYWALQEDLRTMNHLNPLDIVLDTKYYNQFIETPRDKKLFTEETIWKDVIGECVNPQDSISVCLYFLGVNTEEILNLKKQQINVETNTLTLINGDGEVRELVVSEDCMRLCEQALEPRPYEKRNGNSKAKAKALSLVESDYLIRAVQSQTTKGESDRADVHSIYRRLKMLSEELKFPYLQATNIRNSGMLKMYREFYLENDGAVEKEHYFAICERFGLPQSRDVNGEKVYNHYPLRSAFLNEEMMKNVYGDEDSSF